MYEKCPEAVGVLYCRDRLRTRTEPDVATLCGRHFFFLPPVSWGNGSFYIRGLWLQNKEIFVSETSPWGVCHLFMDIQGVSLSVPGGGSTVQYASSTTPLSSSLCLWKSPWGWVSVPSLPPSSPAQQRNVPVNQLFDGNITSIQPLLLSSSNAVQSCFTNIKCVLANLHCSLDLYELFVTCRRGWQEGGLCCSTW